MINIHSGADGVELVFDWNSNSRRNKLTHSLPPCIHNLYRSHSFSEANLWRHSTQSRILRIPFDSICTSRKIILRKSVWIVLYIVWLSERAIARSKHANCHCALFYSLHFNKVSFSMRATQKSATILSIECVKRILCDA